MEALLERLSNFNNGLFIYSDPGAAKPILSIVSLLKNRCPTLNLTIITDRVYSFSTQFHEVIIVDDVVNWLKQKRNYDYLFTGTSYTSNIEKKALSWAIKQKITTFTFIDHWTNMKERFKFENNYVFPNTVLVIDEKAKAIAINEGIESEKLEILSNPYHDYLKNWLPEISRTEFNIKLGLADSNKNIVVYAPDAVSNHNWKKKYGTDEVVILEEILKVFQTIKHKDFYLLIQPHPNQNIGSLQEILDDERFNNIPTEIVLQMDVPTMLYYADMVIGQFSNILLEASLFEKVIIRYIPQVMPDYMEKELGKKVIDMDSFKKAFLYFYTNLV